ncbi:hypothetical protein [Oceaniglobus trochenteri]|uniref:hypothetical protein n=1 Tax=Oceaniglobus trochenteri TaxID=2763260 RepID=UPI001CFFE5AA|nr:hypothetical protein [Oceaniglobus trochenteri]
MVNVLAGLARLLLVLQAALAIVVLVVAAVGMQNAAPSSGWQGVAPFLVGFALLASAGFTAVLFQISDRLGAIHKTLQHGAPRSDTPAGSPPGSKRREPTLRAAR